MDKEKLIEAAKLLNDYCVCEMMRLCITNKCLFYNGKQCALCNKPLRWSIPKLCRWTDNDIALAKALKAFGVMRVERVSNSGILATLGFGNGSCGVPKGAFASLRENEEISIDDIIAEEEA